MILVGKIRGGCHTSKNAIALPLLGGTTQLCHAASTHIAPVSLVSETTQLLEDIIIQHASLTCWQDVIQRAGLT